MVRVEVMGLFRTPPRRPLHLAAFGCRSPQLIGSPSDLLDFLTYAATSSQARRRMVISCGVGGWGSSWRYWAAMMTRRSLASMSRTEGWVFSRYHGASSRAAATSSGWCPAVAYQQTARVFTASANGTVRSTAERSRLRAWPTPPICLASSIATSMDQREAYRSMTCAARAARSVVTSAMSYPVFDLSRTRTTCTACAASTPHHRQRITATETVVVAP